MTLDGLTTRRLVRFVLQLYSKAIDTVDFTVSMVKLSNACYHLLYCEQNLSFAHPDHLCFDRTIYVRHNWSGRTTCVHGPNIS